MNDFQILKSQILQNALVRFEGELTVSNAYSSVNAILSQIEALSLPSSLTRKIVNCTIELIQYQAKLSEAQNTVLDKIVFALAAIDGHIFIYKAAKNKEACVPSQTAEMIQKVNSIENECLQKALLNYLKTNKASLKSGISLLSLIDIRRRSQHPILFQEDGIQLEYIVKIEI